MNVIPYEGLHRFLVESGGTDEEMAGSGYLVDLAANGAIAFCGCKHWEFAISPRINAGEHPLDLDDELFTCKHIRAARHFQASEFRRVPEAQAFPYDEIFWRLMELEPPEFM